MTYRAIKLVARPYEEITPDIFETVDLDTPTLKQGEVLVKLSHLSLDPAMRGWMDADENSYIPPVELDDVMRATGIGYVEQSKHDDFPVGTRVMGLLGMAEYAVSHGDQLNKMPDNLPAEAVLSVIALPGITAYHGLFEVLKPEAGQTIAITAAAGSVGSLVGQMAKNQGLTVIGVAGSKEKCDWLKDELKFDYALNYHEPAFADQLSLAAPDGIDLFFENTGGTAQQPIFEHMKAHGRIAVCGMIADYNSAHPNPGPNWMGIIKRRLTIQGFTMPDHWHRIPEYSQALAQMLEKGELTYRSHVLQGLDQAPSGINLLFSGDNQGKLIVAL